MRDFPAIINETASSGTSEAVRHRSGLDIIRPEYTHPSGFFGVRAGACIQQNTVYDYRKIQKEATTIRINDHD